MYERCFIITLLLLLSFLRYPCCLCIKVFITLQKHVSALRNRERWKWEWFRRTEEGWRAESEGPTERGHEGRGGGTSHQSCVWWLEIRDRIARGDCSLPKGYEHECVCVGGGSAPRGLPLGAAFLVCHVLYGPFQLRSSPSLSTLSTVLPVVQTEGSHRISSSQQP